MSIKFANKGKGCKHHSLATGAMPTISSIVTRRVMSTTTMRTTRIESVRLNSALTTKTIENNSVVESGASTQGVRTRPVDSDIESENNSALHTQEPHSMVEVAEANEGHLYNDLFDSMLKRRLGVMWKPQVKAWVYNGVQNVRTLTRSIIDGTYKSRKPIPVEIYYPKRRTVMAIPFRDRVWQGYLNDCYIYPIMTRSFIWSNMASQTGKGTDKARDLLKKYLWNFYTHHGTDGYVLQIDIHHYYQTIPRDKAVELFRKKLPPNLFRHVEEILDVQYQDSFFAGSQLIQILGIAYLDGIDHYIKERLGIRYYIRYQDDFLLIHHDRAVLENALCEIKAKLAELGLSLNEKKTRIFSLSEPVIHLGFVYTLQSDGKIYMRVNPKRVKEIRRRLKKYPPSFPSYIGFLSKGNSHRLIIRLARELYRDGEA